MHFQEKFRYCPACGSPDFAKQTIKSKQCAACGFVYFINPAAATAAFIRNADGELLVCRRAKEPAKDTLDLPGGFADFDETSEQAIAREVREETGLQLKSIRYLFTLPNDYLYAGLTIPTMDAFFECTIDPAQTAQANDDVSACFFLPMDEINPALFGLKSVRKAVEMYILHQKTKDRTGFSVAKHRTDWA